jgi:tape measure domain-containing protein
MANSLETRLLIKARTEGAAEVDGIANGVQRLGSTSDHAAAAMARIGIRSAAQIQSEINQINQDLMQLAANSKVTATEFDRAFARAQARIDGLQREMSGAVDPFTQSVGRASADIDSLTTKLRPLAGAIAAAFSIDQGVRALIDANVQTERLSRALGTIATPALSAREQLGWLRELADRNGVAFERMAQGFTSFAASTRGSTLEGQKTRDVFDAVVTSMGRMGRSSAQVELALQALSQMASKGVISMEELRGQLAEAMPGALQALANGLGLTNEQLIKMVSEGRLLAEDALPALQRELQKTLATTGPEKVSGMEAGWNRLTNAITRALDAGQDKRDRTGGFLSWLADEVDGLGDRAGSLEASWGGLMRALDTGDWGAYTAAVDAHAAAVAAANDKSAIAAEQQRMLGAAAAQAGTLAQQAESAWVAINNAYGQAAAGAERYTALSVKAAEAKRLEGAAAVQNAELTGNEIAVLEARATAAENNLAAAQQVAEMRAAEVSVIESQIVALQTEAGQTGGLTDAKRAQIKELQELIAQKDAEAQKAREVANVLDAEAKAANRAAFSVESAFKRMGIASSESLNQAAAAARRDFDIIRNSADSTARDITNAFRIVAERTIAANGGIASEAMKAEAAMYGLRIEADATGKAIVRAMGEAKGDTEALGRSAADAAEQYRILGGVIGGLPSPPPPPGAPPPGGGTPAGGGTGSVSWRNADGSLKDDNGGGAARRLDWGQEATLSRAERLGGLELRKQIEREWAGLRNGQAVPYKEFMKAMSRTIGQLDKLQIQQERESKRFAANEPRTVGPVPQDPPRTETFRVEIGTGAGRLTTINTASRADAEALTRLLQQLEADMSRAS